MIRSVLLGTGSALPRDCVSNDELAKRVDTSDEWIVERTGIRQRYIADDSETTSSLATVAARNALDAAGIDAGEIGLIVLATATPDHTFPATATQVQAALGCGGGVAFDVQAVCSGFLYALATADSLLRTGMAGKALVIGDARTQTLKEIWDGPEMAEIRTQLMTGRLNKVCHACLTCRDKENFAAAGETASEESSKAPEPALT